MPSLGQGPTSFSSFLPKVLSSAGLNHTLSSFSCVFDGSIARVSEIPPNTSIHLFEGELLITASAGFPCASHTCALAVPERSEFSGLSSLGKHPEYIFKIKKKKPNQPFFSIELASYFFLWKKQGQPGQWNWRSRRKPSSFHHFYLDWAFILPVLHCI